MQDFRSSFTSNAGSRNSATTGSTQPGGAAAGSQAGGATGCQTATWSQVNENNGDSTDEHPDQHYKLIHLRNNYSALHINTGGGLFTKTSFPGDSTTEDLNLRKDNFGKIQQSFGEVQRVRKLPKCGESVCKVVVENVCEGTGFVLFDNFILTNAHLFKDCIEGEKLKEGVNVFALFNYDDPEPHTDYYYFQLAHQYIFYIYDELDYAILELNPEGHKPNDTTQKIFDVPPGLLNKFGPMPLNGEACIIGHPAGGVKKIDHPFIIEKEKREQAVREHLHPYKDRPFTLFSITHFLKQQGIENIMMGGNRAEKVLTYKTFMYHGSSGSPVFDANGQVVGLHTRGYLCGDVVSVIEYAQPLLSVFEHLVRTLKERGNQELLMRIKEEAKGNRNLEKVLLSVESRKRKASSSEASSPKAKYQRTE